MFFSIFYLFLALTWLTLAPGGLGEPVLPPSPSAFLYSVLLFPVLPLATLLIFLSLKNKKKLKALFYHFYQTALLLSLFISLEMGALDSLMTLVNPALVPLIMPLIFMTLYFSALYLFHYATYYPRTLYPESLVASAGQFSQRQIRTILPFVFPYFFLLFLITALPDLNSTLLTLILLGALTLFALFFPVLVVTLWGMAPIEDKLLLSEMDNLCDRAKFRFRALGTWTVMDHTLTAAIMGILPRFRYILFTKRLLKELPPSLAMAVLAHEIGHAQNGHLYKIPFVILGMPLFTYLILTQADPYISLYAGQTADLATFLLLFISLGLYFRLLFGFFLRMFEREADLYTLKIVPGKTALIEALDHIGTLSGGIHDKPSWHHYSIRERMDFLGRVNNNSALIEQHQRKVRISLAAYTLLLILVAAAIWF